MMNTMAKAENRTYNECRVISLANQKGGVAKSCTTANLAVGLVRENKRVLVIDNDPQGHASKCLGIVKPEKTIADILGIILQDGELNPGDGIVTTEEGVDILPATVKYADMELDIYNAMSREHLLKQYIAMEKPFYDFILIDCPPNLGMFVINALTASDSVIIPVKTEDLAIDGLQQLIKTMGMVRRRLNDRLEIEGILFTIVDVNTNLAKDAISTVRNAYEEKVYIFDTVIPKCVRAAECPASGVSLFTYDPNGKATLAYGRLVREVLG